MDFELKGLLLAAVLGMLSALVVIVSFLGWCWWLDCPALIGGGSMF